MKKYILLLTFVLLAISQNLSASELTTAPAIKFTPIEKKLLSPGEVEMIEGGPQKYLRIGYKNLQTGKLESHYVEEGVDVPGVDIPLYFHPTNPSCYNPNTRSLMAKSAHRKIEVNELPSAFFWNENRITSTVAGTGAFFIADKLFDSFLKNPTQLFARWILKKRFFLKLNTLENRRWQNRISFTIRMVLNGSAFALGYKLMSIFIEKTKTNR